MALFELPPPGGTFLPEVAFVRNPGSMQGEAAFGRALSNGGTDRPEGLAELPETLIVADPLAPVVVDVPEAATLEGFGVVYLCRAPEDLFASAAPRFLPPCDVIALPTPLPIPITPDSYSPPYRFGETVSGGVDVTFDGVPDLLASAPGVRGEPTPLGRGFLFVNPRGR